MFPVIHIERDHIVDTNGAGDAFVGGKLFRTAMVKVHGSHVTSELLQKTWQIWGFYFTKVCEEVNFAGVFQNRWTAAGEDIATFIPQDILYINL